MNDPFQYVLDEALAYARAGYPVFPVDPETKKPFTEHGFKDATTDETALRAMFSRWPVGLAIATTGLVVVDVDDPTSPWLAEEGVVEALASCPTSRTPGGGTHHFFRRPDGFRGKNWNGEVASGIDIKTNGGYVVLPPTTRSEGSYEWVKGELHETPRMTLPVLPDAINRHIERTADRLSTGPRSARGNAAPVDRIPEGRRDCTLTSHAGRFRRQGMSEAEIASELHSMNNALCDPPLPPEQVDKIAASVARYAPVATGNWRPPPPPLMAPRLTFDEVMATPDDGREVLIDCIMRRGDIVNLIGVPKSRKSIMVTQIAMEMATGQPCLGEFRTRQGRTLIIDAEVGAPSLRDRFRLLSAELGIDHDGLARAIEVYDLRGVMDQSGQCEAILASLQSGEFDLVIVDPLYRMLPDGADENDNIEMATFYRMLGHHAARAGFGCFVVHHMPKSNGFSRSTTDAGAGAGSISRAADGQLVLTQHEGGWILKGTFRGFPDFDDRRLQRGDLAWRVEGVVEPKAKGKAHKADRPEPVTKEGFAARFVTASPETADTIIGRAHAAGVSKRLARELLDASSAAGLVQKASKGGRVKDVFRRSEGEETC
ncbi:MAG: bifunctional DNA primase/polymerase [Phycisphaeraceae bacterium]|nr:bifunctional DNA primase/polymerase [Phycisphaeraceae bacterium]